MKKGKFGYYLKEQHPDECQGLQTRRSVEHAKKLMLPCCKYTIKFSFKHYLNIFF